MSTELVTASAVSSTTKQQGWPASNKQPSSKSGLVLRALRRKSGSSLDELCKLTGWQAHSVRGFLAGTVKKKRGLTLSSSKNAGEPRRYRIESKRGR